MIDVFLIINIVIAVVLSKIIIEILETLGKHFKEDNSPIIKSGEVGQDNIMPSPDINQDINEGEKQ